MHAVCNLEMTGFHTWLIIRVDFAVKSLEIGNKEE